MNNDGIVNAILSDANSYADGIYEKAVKESSEIVKNAENDGENFIKESAFNAQKQAEEILKNKRTLINLEIKKHDLTAKRVVIDGVYEKAILKLNSLKKDEYLKFVLSLIENNADKNEKVILSTNAPISEEDVLANSTVKKLGLTVEKSGKFGGGILICNEKFDKDLTFKTIVNELRESTEKEVALELFGYDN